MTLNSSQNLPELSLAIVGMAGQFPGAKNVAEFWQNLVNGVKSIRFFSDKDLLAAGVDPDLLENPVYVKAGTVIEDIDLFDASFFGFAPREAETMDPQSRLLLECAWAALEDAAYDPKTYKGLIGIFAGKHPSTYMSHHLLSNPDIMQLVGELQLASGNDADALATMIAYKLDLKGPTVSVQTFCSTSLVAVHLACQSLLAYECDIALAGGVAIKIPQVSGYIYQEGGVLSSDGECRTFDAKANGSVLGNGLAVVVLKRLEDAVEDGDHIYAVIRGSATSNDGIARVGFTAPGVDGEAAVIAAALGNAGVDAETISYIEAHGTGTPLGDSVELRAMIKAFQQSTDRTQFCAIGSVKPNIGHLDRASGVTGLIKTALALQHKLLPANLNFEKPNPDIGLDDSPFYVNTKLAQWESNGSWPRRAGVSSFGLGGTNVHVVLEEAPELKPSSASRPYQLLLLSAKTEGALEIATSNLVTHLRENPALNPADVAYTLQVGRAVFNRRRMLVCRNAEDAIGALEMADPHRVSTTHQTYQERPVVFMFAGVGEHYVGLAQELYQVEPTFRKWVDKCCELLEPYLELDLRDVLYPERDEVVQTLTQPQGGLDLCRMLGRRADEGEDSSLANSPLQKTELAQPAVFVVEYALAQLLMEWGIRPKALIGYSLGEYVAACVSGVLSLEDALKLVAKRAQMIQALEAGAMLTVSLSEAQVRPFLDGKVALAGVLTPSVCVLAGPTEAIAALNERLTAQDIACRQLPTTHAFHSPMMEPIVDAFAVLVQTVTLNAPEIPYLSNATGDWITKEEVIDSAYWTKHLRQTVRFASGIGELLKDQGQLLLEVGPGQSLGSLVRQHPDCSGEQLHLVLPTLRHVYEQQSDMSFLLNALGKLWLAGVQIDWSGFYQHERRHRVSLPTCPFERFRYWVEPKEFMYGVQPQAVKPIPEPTSRKKPEVADWFYKPIWQKTIPPSLPRAAEIADSPWLIFGDEEGLGEQIADYLTQQGGSVIQVTTGDQFARQDEALFTIRPEEPIDYDALWLELGKLDWVPRKIIHLWSVTRSDELKTGAAHFVATQNLGYYSLIYLLQALGKQNVTEPLEIVIVSSNAQPVTSTEVLHPEKATIFGVCRSIVQECSTINCRTIDLDVPKQGTWLTPAVAKQLVAELATLSTDLEVAYRAGGRYVRAYEAVRLEKQPTSLLRQHGTYLITGGLGSVGLILAEYLARTLQARLVLTGRSGLPDRGEWEEWLATHEDTDSVSLRIGKVQALEALGAEVFVAQADVADQAKMEWVIETTTERFGQIHGVIHTAGVSDWNTFDSVELIKPNQCEAHFRPKVHGLYVLEAVLADQKLDFCVLFSSLSSVLGGLGFAGYTAANIFMDTFAHKYNRLATSKWISVNWDTWRTREDQHKILGRTVVEYEMTPAEGVQAFERVLAHEIDTQIVNSTGDLDTRIREWIMLESLQDEAATVTPASGRARPDLPTAYVTASNDYERIITTVWQELLGIEEVGIYDNFFDLGGNSLIGLQVIARLKKELDVQIPVVALFEAPNASTLAKYLRPDHDQEEDLQRKALVERRKQARRKVGQQGVAVIGMAGKFPGAKDLEQFWANLCNGVESLTFFTDEELIASGVSPEQINDPNYVKARPILEDAGLFDAPFFGYSPRAAELTDPQHRLILECAWEALERAGYDSKIYPGLIGMFAGENESGYIHNMYRDRAFMSSLGAYEVAHQMPIGNQRDSLVTTVSYKLNLKGPSLTVQTFCSTSLIATHLACQSLLNGECDIALAGGVSIRVPVTSGYMYVEEGGMESPDGHCRAFDAQGDGTPFGDGVGIVVLRRLEDALEDGDFIYAVIKGSAVNNDGSLKVGYSAPSVDGQADAVAAALENAGVTGDMIDYVEAHGTATQLGDPIEVAALTKAFRRTTDATGYCAIGSVKTNIGHVDRAAGVSGLIKTVLALKHGLIPPSLHFETPNPEIDFENSPFYVNTELREWKSNGRPRLAGVSSFGMGGANAHVVLEKAPERGDSDPSRPRQLLLLSARTELALDKATANLAGYLRQNPTTNLADVAYTLQVGRTRFDYRRMVACQGYDDALEALEAHDSPRVLTYYHKRNERPIAFMFPGLGDHYVNMGRELYHHELTFREEIDHCCAFLSASLGLDLQNVLYPPQDPQAQGKACENGKGLDLREMLGRGSQRPMSEATKRLQQTALAQPTVFVVEYALARLLVQWGIRPQAMIGYSLGEYVAACLSGVLSLEDALTLVAKRTRMIQALPKGAMLAISLPAKEVGEYVNNDLSLAAVNGPNMSVVAGSVMAVAELEERLVEQGVACRQLTTIHAFHSHMMEPITADLARLIKSFKLSAPRIPYISNVTGTWITPEQATDPTYWAQHLRQAVQFAAGVSELLSDPERLLIEVGPGYTLGSIAKLHPDCDPERGQLILPTLRHAHDQQSDLAFLFNSLGKMWLSGVRINWNGFYANEKRHRLPLPTYPFERQRYWLEPRMEQRLLDISSEQRPAATDSETQQETSESLIIEDLLSREPEKITDLADWFFVPVWQSTAPRPRVSDEILLSQNHSWLIFLDGCGLGERIAARLQQGNQQVTMVRPYSQFTHLGQNEYTLSPGQRADYEKLIEALRAQDRLPTKIVHLWTVTSVKENSVLTRDELEETLEFGFYSLLFLTQALGNLGIEYCEMAIVSSDMQDVTDNTRLRPAKATVLGPCRVVPQEFTNMSCCSIDVTVPPAGSRQVAVLVEQLLGELVAELPKQDIALRGTSRWVRTYEPMPLAVDSGHTQRLREGGVYLITGGLGGIGLAIAQYLVQQVQAKVVLLGRSSLPPRGEWLQLLEKEGDAAGSVGYKIRQVQILEKMGAEVLVLAADVANREQMRAAVDQILARFGTLHGVVHAAGLPASGLILLKDLELVASVFAPKVVGTLVLHEVLQDIPLDFMVLFSSMSSITGGGPGQVDYCAVNAFLDAFARRNVMENGLTVAVGWGEWQWDAWQEGLEGFQPGIREFFKARRQRFGISFEEGCEALRRVLSHQVSHFVVSTQDFQVLVKGSSEFSAATIMDEYRKIQGKRAKYPRPALGTSYVAPSNDLERTIAAIWSDLLGIDEIGVHDNFFELGGNSLVGIDMIARLKKNLNVEKIAAHVVYEAPSVSALAKFLDQDQEEKALLTKRLERGRKRYQQKLRRRRPTK